MRRFKDGATRDLWERRSTKVVRRTVPPKHLAKAQLRLDYVYQVATMAAFTALPPGVQFKELQGALRGTYHIRIAGRTGSGSRAALARSRLVSFMTRIER